MAKNKLSDKQKQFCLEYIKDDNATQAAVRVGYSEKTAKQQGSRLLTNVDIKSYISHLKEQRTKRTEIDADWMLKWQQMIVQADFTDIIDSNSNTTLQYKDLKKLPKEIRLCIKQIKATNNGIEVTFYDKQKAHDMIAKHIEFYGNSSLLDDDSIKEINIKIKRG